MTTANIVSPNRNLLTKFSVHAPYRQSIGSIAEHSQTLFTKNAPLVGSRSSLQILFLFAEPFEQPINAASHIEQWQMALTRLTAMDRTIDQLEKQTFDQNHQEVNKLLDDFYSEIQKELTKKYCALILEPQKNAAKILAHMSTYLMRLQLHSLPIDDIYEAIKTDFHTLVKAVSSIPQDALPEIHNLDMFNLSQILQIGYRAVLGFSKDLQDTTSHHIPKYENYLTQIKALLSWIEMKYIQPGIENLKDRISLTEMDLTGDEEIN